VGRGRGRETEGKGQVRRLGAAGNGMNRGKRRGRGGWKRKGREKRRGGGKRERMKEKGAIMEEDGRMEWLRYD